MNDQEKRIEASKALDFLRSHPAISPDYGGDSIFTGFWFMMAECCKRGVSKDASGVTIKVYPNDEEAERFADRFTKECGEDWRDQENPYLHDVDIPYEEYYGEPWKFDHVEYWYETTFFVFTGNPYYMLADHNPKNWSGYCGPEGGANTWEDMIIDCAKKVKEAFGDFNDYESFLTDAEKYNHKTEDFCFFIQCEEKKHFKSMELNKRYVRVNDGLINLRWLKWFADTDQSMEDWGEDTIEEWQSLIQNAEISEPQERKDILSAYTNS